MKITFAFAILFCTLTGICQNNGPIAYGPILSVTSSSLKAIPTIGDIDPKMGFGVGAFARLHIFMLYAEIEGGYTTLNTKSQLLLSTGVNVQTDYKLDGWDLSTYVGWRIFRIGDNGNLRVFGGYTYKDISKISIRSDLTNLQNLQFDSKYKGFNFGVGFDVWRLAFNVKFTRGLGDIENFNVQKIINNYSSYSIGFKF